MRNKATIVSLGFFLFQPKGVTPDTSYRNLRGEIGGHEVAVLQLQLLVSQ